MKRLAYISIAALLAAILLLAGCAQPAPAPEKATPSSIRGTVEEIGDSSITVNTPRGEFTIPITPETQFLWEGKACSLEEAKVFTESVDEVCTVIYDEETNEAIIVDFYQDNP